VSDDRTYSWRVGRDKFAAPYSAAAFERTARRYFNGPKLARFVAVASLMLALIMFLGASALFATAAKALYLETYGIEAQGRILDVSFHTSYANHKYVEWEKLNYEFTASSGESVRGQLDRPVDELTNLPEGDRFTVRYWDRFPAINGPLGVDNDAWISGFLAGVLLLGCIHFSCLWRRTIRWYRCVTARTASTGGFP
jgi:hypothetical protein